MMFCAPIISKATGDFVSLSKGNIAEKENTDRNREIMARFDRITGLLTKNSEKDGRNSG